MSAMASQITSVLFVCSAIRSGADHRKYQSSALLVRCEGNRPITGGFPSQRSSNAENVSIWWRHNDYANLHVILSPCQNMTIYMYIYVYIHIYMFLWLWHIPKMADVSKWWTFNKEANMAWISILQIFQSEERYLNAAIRIATPH